MSSVPIYFKRGAESGLPALAAGEPGFTTDTFKLFVGSAAGNKLIGPGSGGGYTDEQVRDVVAAFLVAGANVTLSHNDAADTLTIAASSAPAYTDEQVRDVVAAFLVAGANVTLAHNDAADTLTIAATGGGGGGGTTILDGAGAPGSGVGVPGNYYEDTLNQVFYGPRGSGTNEEKPTVNGTPAVNGTYELGAKWSFTAAGSIIRLRYYRLASSTATLNFRIWNNDAGNAQLTTVSDTRSGQTGWFEVALPAPVNVPAGGVRTCTYNGTGGNGVPIGQFPAIVTSTASVTWLEMRYGSQGNYPQTAYNNETYFVEPIYQVGASLWPVAVRVVDPTICQGRLTLSATEPLPTADITNTVLYYLPYVGARVALYDGTTWSYVTLPAAGASLVLSGLSDYKIYDVFGYASAGALALELTAWQNTISRVTQLARQDGVLVKNGDATRRYLGTIIALTPTTSEDSASRRFVWNAYNRAPRALLAQATATSWVYSAATWRAAGGVTTTGVTRVEVVCGLPEAWVEAAVALTFFNSGAGGGWASPGIGIDTPAGSSAQMAQGWSSLNTNTPGICQYRGHPGQGYHYLQWTERTNNAGTTTWYGANFSQQQSALTGVIHA